MSERVPIYFKLGQVKVIVKSRSPIERAQFAINNNIYGPRIRGVYKP